MKHITEVLLKHGIKGLLSENGEFFKQNITQALAIKLDETVKETRLEINKKLLFREQYTQDTPEVADFINFIKTFNPGTYTFKNGSNINITESEIKLLTKLFESLNPTNRQKMVSEILTDGGIFKEHISFSKKVTNLL
jgi:hypothetical protein